MNSNQIILAGAIFGLVALIAPSLAIPIGNHYKAQISVDDMDRVSMWRNARFAYRISKFSPLFWSSSTTRIREVDLELSNSMFEMIIEGSDGGFNDEDHLLFLSSREDHNYWGNQEALAQLRYGHPQKALNILAKESKPNANYGLVASLMTGSESDFIKWLPNSDAPAGIFLLSTTPQIKDHPLVSIHNLYIKPQKEGWEKLLEEVPQDFSPVALEAYMRSYLIEYDALNSQKNTKQEQPTPDQKDPDTEIPNMTPEEDLKDAADTKGLTTQNQAPSWLSKELIQEKISAHDEAPCVQLLASVILDQPLLRLKALAFLDTQEFYFTQITQGAHLFCHPDVFERVAQEAEGLEKSKLYIYAAHAYLGQHHIAKTQKTIKKAEAYPLDGEEYIRSIYLRARARELASDTAGLEKYARKGLDTESPVFQSLMGKASLLKGNKTDSIWVLHQEGSNLSLPLNLRLEYADLCSIAKRFGGNAIKIKINNEDVGYGKWERSKEFRSWYSEYLQKITQLPPSASPPLPILLNNQRVEQNGNFLMRAVIAEKTDPLQISIRAMLKFNYHSIRSNSEKSTAWKEFKKSRIWLEKLPFPQLLSSHPELFQINLGTL